MKVKSLTIIVPAYNEEKALEQSIDSLVSAIGKVLTQSEIIVVNDGSVDGTARILDSLAEKYSNVKAIHHEKNRMIGAAFLSGLHFSTSSHLILIPVDNPLTSEELSRFIQPMENADIVVGCRPQRTGYKAWMSFSSRIYWWICRILFNEKIRDFTWISMYDREKISALSLKFSGIAIFPEILVKAMKRGYQIQEIDCPMTARRIGRATISRVTRITHLFFETVHLWFHIHFEKW